MPEEEHGKRFTTPLYRNSQKARGWTEEFCRYLDHFTTIDISYTAPWHQRHRYQSTITLVCNDDDRQAGPMRARKDFQFVTKILTRLRQERGRQDSFIPKNERVRQRLFDEALRAELEWQSQHWKTYWSQPFSHHPHNNGGNRLNGANTKTLYDEITDLLATDSFKNPMWQPLWKILAHL